MVDAFVMVGEVISFLGEILLWTWPFIIIFWLIIMKVLHSKWPVEVIIIEKRGSNLVKTNDRAGRYTDPYTGVTGYKLKKAKDTVPVVNYEWVMHNNAIPTWLPDRLINILRGNIGTIFFFRYGSKQYKPIQITKSGKNTIVYREVKKDKDGKPILIKVYQPIDPRDKLGALDFDVIDWDNMNFMVQEQRASIVRRSKRSETWRQLIIPIAMLIVVSLVCIIAIKLSFDFASGVRSSGAITPKAEPPASADPLGIIPGK